LFWHEDSEGSSKIEEQLKKILGVNEVEILEESLV
jgi:translation elongation factor EF-1beta